MPRRSSQMASKADKKKQQQEWENAMEAVIRDITQGAKHKESPVVQIVIYESSV